MSQDDTHISRTVTQAFSGLKSVRMVAARIATSPDLA